MLKYIVDSVIASKDLTSLLMWSIAYSGAYIVYGIFEFLKSFILIKVSQGICKNLRIGLLEKVHSLSYETLSSYDIGSIESLFNNDVNTINNLVSDGVISMIIDLFKMIGVMISIFVLSTNIGYLVLSIVPFILVFVIIVKKRMFLFKLRAKQMESNVNQRVLENIENVEAVQSFKAYDYVSTRYEQILSTHYDAQKSSMFYDSLFPTIMQIIKYTLVATVIMVSVINPSVFGITIGTFLSVSDLLSDMFTPMEAIGMELQTLQESTASIHRINDFIKSEDKPKKDNCSLSDSSYTLEFKDVYYSYTSSEQVIQGFSYKLNQGDKLTLQGNSGVGKSTLFKLGYGLLIPNKGQVSINRVDVSSLSEETRRNIFGIVYQDPFFSLGSIREELTLEGTSISDDEIFSVLKKIGLERITDLNSKLNENDYSSGELALFNIARILLRKPKIIFLDEMNAKIDPSTALKIISILNENAKDSTILSITHYGTQLKNSISYTLKAK